MARRRKVHVHEQRREPFRNPWRTFPIMAQIERAYGGSRKNAYQACVEIARGRPGAGGHRRDFATRASCAFASAPRRALGLALRKLGMRITRRSSAFRGT